MKPIHIAVILFLLSSFLSFAQDQKMMYDKLITLHPIEDVAIFSNENTLVALQSDLGETRSVYHFKVTRMDTAHIDELTLKYDTTRTHIFFGGHFSDDNFVIFEAEYSIHDQLLVIKSHLYYTYDKEFKTTTIHKGQNFGNTDANFKLVQSDNQKFQAICYMPNEKIIETLILMSAEKTTKQKFIRPLSRLELAFDFQATISNSGILSLLVENRGSKEEKFSLISYNIMENKNAQFTNLLLDKSEILQSTKLFYDRDTLELYALVRESQKDKTTKLFYWQTIPIASKETRAVLIKKFDSNVMSTIHSLIKLPNGSSALCISETKKSNVIIKNPKYQIREDMSPEEKQAIQNKLDMLELETHSKDPIEAEKMRELNGVNQYLSVVFLDKDKKISWLQNMPEFSTSSNIYNASSHSYYIWANRDQLICVYNAEVARLDSKPTTTLSSNKTKDSRTEFNVVPTQRIFNIKDGTFQDNNLMKFDPVQGEIFIPKSTRIANASFAWMFFYIPDKGIVPTVFKL